jgi:hypothetical protein
VGYSPATKGQKVFQIQEENVKLLKLTAALSVLMLLALTAAAQEPGNIAALEFQTPKNGMLKQYEDGRKQKAEWHRQQKDTQPLLVFQTLTGERTGTYMVGRVGLHWADFDKPSVPDADDLAQYQKLVGSSVESLVTSYWEFMPKWSNPSTDMGSKYTEVITFHIRFGHGDDFRSAIARAAEARQKTNSQAHASWYRLVNGGPGGTFVVTIPHANFASMADDPAIKPLRDDLRTAFGEQEAMSVIERLNSSVESTSSELMEFRPDLSYIPAK